MRVGTIIQVESFPEAHNPAYKVWVDFGQEIGTKKTSAQITKLYTKEELIWKQIIWVLNFPPKQVSTFMSEFLITWVHSLEWVVLTSLDKRVANGLKIL